MRWSCTKLAWPGRAKLLLSIFERRYGSAGASPLPGPSVRKESSRRRTTVAQRPTSAAEHDDTGGRRVLGLLPAAAAILSMSLVCLAQNGQPTLDELLDLEPRGVEPEDPRTSPAPGPPGSNDGEAIEQSVQRLLTAEQSTDLFEQVVQEMDEVSVRLGRWVDSGLQTQRLQQSILAKLDQLIAAARQQSTKGGSASSGSDSQAPWHQDRGSRQVASQNQGAGQSAGAAPVRAGGGQYSGDPSTGRAGQSRGRERSLEELRSEWGNLPRRLREELSEGLGERFSPVYRALTEAYYRRLAEQP